MHPTEALNVFCRDCSCLVCRDCLVIDHRKHDFVFAKDVAPEMEERVRSLLEASQGHDATLVAAIVLEAKETRCEPARPWQSVRSMRQLIKTLH